MPLSSPLWISFFGRPALISPDGGETPLTFRYRKSLALLAWLSAHLDHPQRRHTLADLLWPELDQSSASANLRVALNDLVARWSALGLADTLQVDREWLVLRPNGRIVTDEVMVCDPAIAERFGSLFARRTAQPWFEIGKLEALEDFGDWLRGRRAWLESHLQAFSTAGQGHAGGEVRAASVLSVGSTVHWRRLAILRVMLENDEHADERVALTARRAWIARLDETLRPYGGQLANEDAEGASFVFGHAAADGSFCRQALVAAQACLSIAPKARLGLCAGHVFTDVAGRFFQGRRLADAGRLALCAEAGSLACDDSMMEIIAPLNPRSKQCAFRGRAGEITVHHLDAKALGQALLLPMTGTLPMFGRDEDLARVLEALERGVKVIVCGRPGIGKTRLAQAVAERMRACGVFWLVCRAEMRYEAWAPLLELLARTPLDALPVRAAEALRDVIASRHVAMSARGAVLRGLDALFGQALVVVDDAQWLDEATWGLLDELTRTSRARWLLARRPEEGGWLPTHAIIHELAPLDDAAALALVDHLAGGTLARQRVRGAVANGRGIPLFLIAGAQADNASLADAVAGLCNLPGQLNAALDAAALLGQRFRHEDLAALVGAQACDAALEAALQRGVVLSYRSGEWSFFHPLLRETCLIRLDLDDTRRLAARAARRFLDRGENARAAELFEKAEDLPQARAAWLAAAQAALAEEDAVAACTLFGELARLGYPQGREGDWARLGHTRALIMRYGYGIREIAALCEPVAAAHRDAADAEGRELYFAANALMYLWRCGESPASGLDLALHLVTRADSESRRFAATWARANTRFFLGDFAQARPDLEALLASRLDARNRVRYFPSDAQPFYTLQNAWLCWFMGISGWRETIVSYLAQTQDGSSRQNECIARVFAAATYLCAGEHEVFARHAEQALEIAQAEAFAMWEASATMLVQIVQARAGRAPDPAVCDALEAAKLAAYPAGINTARWLIAEAWVAARRWDQALSLLERTLAVARQTEHQYCLPDLHRLHAAALAGAGRVEEATRAMREAVRIAQERGYAGWLARWQDCRAITDHRA